MLQHLPFFQMLTDEELRLLLDRAAIREYSPGTIVFMEGDVGDTFSVILEGELEIIKSFASEGERIINVIHPNEFLGELSLVHQGRRRSATGRARGHVRMIDIPLGVFESIIRQNAELSFTLMQIMSLRMMESENATIEDLKEKNQQLAQSLYDLKQVQGQLIEKEKMGFELEMARRIQESMLPRSIPNLPGWRLDAHWQPARSVSGDFYDFIPLPDGRIAVIVGDVTGKGMPAALMMAVTRSILRASVEQCQTPGELLARANDLLCPDIPPKMFVTCHVSYLEPSTGRITFANAGHCLPIWQHNGEISELRASGMPLGLMEGMAYQGSVRQIAPGDRLLYYSDGLIEARDSAGSMVGVPRIKELLTICCQGCQKHNCEIISFLLDEMQKHTGAASEQEDDITLVCLAYAP